MGVKFEAEKRGKERNKLLSQHGVNVGSETAKAERAVNGADGKSLLSIMYKVTYCQAKKPTLNMLCL